MKTVIVCGCYHSKFRFKIMCINFSITVLLVFIVLISSVNASKKLSDHNLFGVREAIEVINFDTFQFLRKYNYSAERHKVVTEDGYILNLFRIPNEGPPVMLVHGIGDSSDSWLVLGPNDSLVCGLANAGYDVWIFNSRGNKYSDKHVENITDKVFWDFTFEEMGTQDLPSTIDYILKITSRKKLTYIGFSQGTTVFFVMCSLKPEYNDKVNYAIMLAPVAWINHTRYLLIDFFTKILRGLQSLAEGIGLNGVFKSNQLVNLYHIEVCNNGSVLRFLCEIEFYVNYGLRYITNLPSAKLPTLASHIPAGVSSKTLFHFLQIYESKRFQRYDYGHVKNQMLYNSKHPPEYNLTQVNVPLAMIMSESDWFSNNDDVEYLRGKLKSIENYIVINRTIDFTHIEFIYGKRVNNIVNKPVINLIQNFYSGS